MKGCLSGLIRYSPFPLLDLSCFAYVSPEPNCKACHSIVVVNEDMKV
ncbi:hypothetical protein COLO4_24329 [Corchorus olitorius]|uniref:Uncharacterized protein n=1 Tax=Corchorus olitorius TaxID=93759 RepID=A0A1R3IAZ0_9ROSI|nr:hypothetical protein COLO4_24329 [Corchorus olitorius]